MIWQFIADRLSQQPVLLLIVVASHGSTPAKIGAKMAVTDTQILGTIGGGAIEHALIKTARQCLKQADFHYQLSQYHHNPSKHHASGMICGGSQTVLMYACKAQELPLYQQLATDKPITLHINANGLNLQTELIGKARFNHQNDDWHYQETINLKKRAYIIGGGHVSLALSRILVTLDFQITIIEQRLDIASFENNHYAQQKINAAYTELNKLIPEHSYVFIMTHSHKTDAVALTQLHNKPLAYLGLLGSQSKISQLLAHYSKIQNLYAPMGLTINSHTPEEIAISIAAELIQLFNKT